MEEIPILFKIFNDDAIMIMPPFKKVTITDELAPGKADEVVIASRTTTSVLGEAQEQVNASVPLKGIAPTLDEHLNKM